MKDFFVIVLFFFSVICFSQNFFSEISTNSNLNELMLNVYKQNKNAKINVDGSQFIENDFVSAVFHHNSGKNFNLEANYDAVLGVFVIKIKNGSLVQVSNHNEYTKIDLDGRVFEYLYDGLNGSYYQVNAESNEFKVLSKLTKKFFQKERNSYGGVKKDRYSEVQTKNYLYNKKDKKFTVIPKSSKKLGKTIESEFGISYKEYKEWLKKKRLSPKLNDPYFQKKLVAFISKKNP